MARTHHGASAPLLLTVPQVAELLQIARGRAYDLVASGALPVIKVGERSIRVPYAGLLTWIEQESMGMTTAQP